MLNADDPDLSLGMEGEEEHEYNGVYYKQKFMSVAVISQGEWERRAQRQWVFSSCALVYKPQPVRVFKKEKSKVWQFFNLFCCGCCRGHKQDEEKTPLLKPRR